MKCNVQSCDSFFGKDPIAGMRSGRLRQQAVPFVVPDRLDIDAAPFGGFGGTQSFHVLSIGPYCGTEFKSFVCGRQESYQGRNGERLQDSSIHNQVFNR